MIKIVKRSQNKFVSCLLMCNRWLINKQQEKVLLWYKCISRTAIEMRTCSCVRMIFRDLTIFNACSSLELSMAQSVTYA